MQNLILTYTDFMQKTRKWYTDFMQKLFTKVKKIYTKALGYSPALSRYIFSSSKKSTRWTIFIPLTLPLA